MMLRSLLMAGAAVLACAGPARASYTVVLSEVNQDVVATGSGSLDLGAFSLVGQQNSAAFLTATSATVLTGSAGPFSLYAGSITGPASFGFGSLVATSGSGPLAGIAVAASALGVPVGYVSGSFLSDSAVYAGQTLASLGLMPGTYSYDLGSGTDRFTVQIGAPTAVPEPAGLAVLGLPAVLAGLIAVRRAGRGIPGRFA